MPRQFDPDFLTDCDGETINFKIINDANGLNVSVCSA
ncbi:hypothetical protein TRN7648_00630 [Tropicibacter naphthalenivorans]|uniref:Uncharacterized protein n=1 Tax=Tropicibacter naphthalenivorans TaxID=441103 RepID=A0A0P1G1W5_9RHOB|nr:hypothetical protein TRN7648_00630 [Tropicibacter naphthalenivorans]